MRKNEIFQLLQEGKAGTFVLERDKKQYIKLISQTNACPTGEIAWSRAFTRLTLNQVRGGVSSPGHVLENKSMENEKYIVLTWSATGNCWVTYVKDFDSKEKAVEYADANQGIVIKTDFFYKA
jgi:hypothetical protein